MTTAEVNGVASAVFLVSLLRREKRRKKERKNRLSPNQRQDNIRLNQADDRRFGEEKKKLYSIQLKLTEFPNGSCIYLSISVVIWMHKNEREH